ncbi:putative NADH-ubiquinone oxidoreductase 9.5 kDa subunit, partial [Schizophyllum commune]
MLSFNWWATRFPSVRAMQYYAHEKPALFYALVIGGAGPLLIATVPPLRKAYGYVPPEMPPTSYPCCPNARATRCRPRTTTQS